MLDFLIRWSLNNRVAVALAALIVLAAGVFMLPRIPLDVFPELNAPTVTIMTEAPGYAAEEVELAVTFPLEVAVNGLPGVRRVRSSSSEPSPRCSAKRASASRTRVLPGSTSTSAAR